MNNDPEAIAAELAQQITALREEADRIKLHTLSYLLSLAEAEAYDTANGKRWLDLGKPYDPGKGNRP